MADQLATPSDLASLLKLTYASLSVAEQATMTLLVECATAVVQECAGQRIVDLTDTAVIDIDPWTNDYYLDLPQFPVRSVSQVVLDGNTITDWLLRNQRLWRVNGWMMTTFPSQVKVTYTHGYSAGSQYLQMARKSVLSLAAGGYPNPDGATSVKIDDYAATYEAMAARMEESPHLREALKNAYGQSAYVTSSR